MATSVQLIADGTTYHLHNSNKVPTAGGALTAATTTPLVIDDAWVLRAASGLVTYGGGPPFRVGSSPIAVGYGNVEDEFTLRLWGSSSDNVIATIRTLRRAFNTAFSGVPATLTVQPDGHTSVVAFEVYRAEIQEEKQSDEEGFESPTEGAQRIVIRVRLTRSVGARLSSGETLLNNASFANAGTGATDNVVAYSSGSGDLIYEGGPLNILMTPASSGGTTAYLSSIYARAYSTTGAAALSTSSTTGVTASLANWDVSAALTRQLLKARILIHATVGSNAQFRMEVYFSSTYQLLYTSPYFSTTGGTSTLLDTGYFPLTAVRRTKGSTQPVLIVLLRYRSTDGLSATVTLTSSQYLLYYDWCVLNPQRTISMSGSDAYLIDSFPEQTDAVCLPYAPRAYVFGTTEVLSAMEVRGTAPRYFSGSSLFAVYLGASGVYTTANTMQITATHAPLYLSARGGG